MCTSCSRPVSGDEQRSRWGRREIAGSVMIVADGMNAYGRSVVAMDGRLPSSRAFVERSMRE